jgi:tetratricopeptide (TPR) repeat protein
MMTPGSHTPWIELLGISLLITLTGSYGTSVTDGRSAAHDSSATVAAFGIPVLRVYEDPAADAKLRFLEDRVSADRDDVTAENRLTTECLRRLRLTGNLAWLYRADESSRRSLESVPAVANFDGLVNRAAVETEFHHFVTARDAAKELCAAEPDNPKGYELLGDALVELGDYAVAASAYRQLQALTTDLDKMPEIDVRLAHLAWIYGDDKTARSDYEHALAAAQSMVPPFLEMIAFCHVQLGQLDFGVGEWDAAETHYRSALSTFPNFYPALDHLAELEGAKGNYDLASDLYKEVIEVVPRPEFYQMLADLCLYAQRPEEAKPWQKRAESAYLDSVRRGEVFYYHNLASFYSDTAKAPAEAVQWARKDCEQLHAVFAEEGLGWALYKNGDYQESNEAFDRAVALGTRSAHLLYQAGLAYFSSGKVVKGKEFIQRTYAVNPRFDTFHVHR